MSNARPLADFTSCLDRYLIIRYNCIVVVIANKPGLLSVAEDTGQPFSLIPDHSFVMVHEFAQVSRLEVWTPLHDDFVEIDGVHTSRRETWAESLT